MIENYITDILYKKISFSANDLKLFQTKELSRLRRVSLNTCADWASLTSSCCSRFEHSLGVWHLAKLLAAKREFAEIGQNLRFAALAHDLATPPFSHSSEKAMKKILGKDHEEIIDEIIFNSEFGKEVEKQGGNLRIISDLIQKRHPLSNLINGSIDLDNLDNTLRWGFSTGVISKKNYSPEKLARSFTIKDGKLALIFSDDLKKWEQCRKVAYKYIYTIYPEFIISRALDFALEAEEIDGKYFQMDDFEASQFLKNNCNSRTKEIVERAERWQLYPLVFNLIINRPDDGLLRRLKNPQAQPLLADFLAKSLGFPREDIVAGVIPNKGYKKIHLPIINDGEEEVHKPNQKDVWYIHIYLFEIHTHQKSHKIAKLVKDYFN